LFAPKYSKSTQRKRRNFLSSLATLTQHSTKSYCCKILPISCKNNQTLRTSSSTPEGSVAAHFTSSLSSNSRNTPPQQQQQQPGLSQSCCWPNTAVTISALSTEHSPSPLVRWLLPSAGATSTGGSPQLSFVSPFLSNDMDPLIGAASLSNNVQQQQQRCWATAVEVTARQTPHQQQQLPDTIPDFISLGQSFGGGAQGGRLPLNHIAKSMLLLFRFCADAAVPFAPIRACPSAGLK
jgi:hypothetical protein